jgi:hypothetical protein
VLGCCCCCYALASVLRSFISVLEFLRFQSTDNYSFPPSSSFCSFSTCVYISKTGVQQLRLSLLFPGV